MSPTTPLNPTSPPTLTLISNSTPVAQGAEAKVYKSILHPSREGSPVSIFVKYRFTKQYRHPTLDTNLTRARVAGEARALMKCLRSGVNVPGIRMVDASEGVLGTEWIEGKSVRALLGGGADDEGDDDELLEDGQDTQELLEEDTLKPFGLSQDTLMSMIGTEIAKMHLADVIHGDLTTSNMMLPFPSPSHLTLLYLVDFGLSFTSPLTEDKAVDLYVLERAFSSTHPDSSALFARVLDAYAKRVGEKEWGVVGRRLDDVRLRGRKRSMVG
ncbi:hypothetical protein JAAARDRAFT_34869 [Jaapia argillacea MUCL 33604]|uniref:non-specific serine/threonine protein kinase n=1 Tax=Jaapia argillacea MUCL 33604 TaxID=933084 RepID=A0A067PTL8_9AGAM|nr:hypothetical protein JAAARDRAFT_34869 [Jaapia argillacea MUCL 33604]